MLLYGRSGGVLKNRILTVFLPDSRKMPESSIPACLLIFKKKISRHIDNSGLQYGMKNSQGSYQEKEKMAVSLYSRPCVF
jgi:hypothetical protein